MIDQALLFLKDSLNGFLNSGLNPTDPHEDQVVFINGDKLDPLVFNLGTISILLVNVEQENILRPADPYRQFSRDGKQYTVQPDIRINLYVLFVAHYNKYEDALHNLSQVIGYFQNHRLFKSPEAPGLSDQIDQLLVELVTLPFSEQNEIWSALRVSYHPSVLYKLRMLVFKDDDKATTAEIEDRTIRMSP